MTVRQAEWSTLNLDVGAVKSALLAALLKKWVGAHFEFRDGLPPSRIDGAPTGQLIARTPILTPPEWADGSADASTYAELGVTTVAHTGMITWYRVVAADGHTVLQDGRVGHLAIDDMQMSYLAWVAGEVFDGRGSTVSPPRGVQLHFVPNRHVYDITESQ